MKLIRHQTSGFQSENWIIDSSVHWKRVGRIGWDDLQSLEQHPSHLWINSDDSTIKGVNDRVSVARSRELTDSLKIIQVSSATITVDQPYEPGKDLEVRAEFSHSDSRYILKVTDCVYAERYRRKGAGRYRIGESFLTVSLGEEWNDYYYKLVAAIIERPKE
jgi:hypothetical protein